MCGSWHWYMPEEPWQRPAWQASLVLETADKVYVCFNAKEVEFVRRAGVRERTLAARLENDLLAGTVDYAAIMARAREFLDPETIIADVLLDQRVASGIGNVYKSEVLFLERLHPETPLAVVPDSTIRRLYATARRLLRANLHSGPRVTRNDNDGAGRLWVYGRRGERCHRCGGGIAHAGIGRTMRGTYFCRDCQT
jgi:endonuclease-8